MGILEIGLTIWAWHRGWKAWALLPLGIGLCLLILIALILQDAGMFKIYAPGIGAFIFIDGAIVAVLIFMVAKAKEKSNITGSTTGLDPFLAHSGACQRGADESGVNIKNATVSLPITKAKLTLPNNADIALNGIIRPIGRGDFEGQISSSTLRYISRQHFWIRSDRGKYFLEDYQSTNGTRLNGIAIKGKGLHLLNDGDKIEISGIVVLIFKVLL